MAGWWKLLLLVPWAAWLAAPVVDAACAGVPGGAACAWTNGTPRERHEVQACGSASLHAGATTPSHRVTGLVCAREEPEAGATVYQCPRPEWDPHACAAVKQLP